MFRFGNIIKKKESKDPEFTQKTINKWKPLEKEFYELCNKIDQTNIKKISDKEFASLYKIFRNTYITEYSIPMMADTMGHFLEVDIEKKLINFLKKKNKEKEYNKIINLLSKPVTTSFLGDEKYELFLIVKDYLEGKDIKKNIKEHSKKWHWIQNNYVRIIILDKKYFFFRVKEHSKNKKEVLNYINNYHSELEKCKKEKEHLMKELEFNKELRLLIKLTEEYTDWQDQRKKANLIAHYYIGLFLKEASKRTKINLQSLEYTTGFELEKILEGKKVNIKEIKQRQKLTGVIFTPKKGNILNFEKAQQLEKEIDSFNKEDIFGDLRGNIANLGKATGKVKIIKSHEDFHKMNKGDILVTSMTRPEFVPVMKKAAAIVTDEGGITCHAAIISRELGIPCIIGTKAATRILKDNDIIEVNANHGTVKKIK
ncbi:MAG: hypothetical protein KKF89_00335 [Nanoarchaeota archaeon]|nr:hypothetical protein [Nanoarchaeota archaeon]MBU1854143.1 hypothetical protein [Nanoarchaeota archaeon]